ncbi:DUF1990 family protein [Gordonia sp. SID5947]|uniref:DUF1990 family protein n=1 Tax=Gordonia sp. SID5947 TaxID=2690315 RepID=UPI0013705451|nr:DUF1990 domain-containing protein [Gordonia sp. SID5947]MYR07749.1 DUF1990 family protein [Gordonia sp. SID5947]
MTQQRQPLDAKTEQRLRRASLTYPEVGASSGRLPVGYRHLNESVDVGAGAADFTLARRALFEWQVQLRAGVAVASSDRTVEQDGVAVLTIGIGRVGVRAPVRIVEVLDDERRAAFAYGTLPGHPECGEERFALEHHADDTVTFTVTAFSRPHSRLARVAGPVGHLAQALITRRYQRSLIS